MSERYVEARGWETRVLRSPEGRVAIRGLANKMKDEIAQNVPVKDGDLQAWYERTARVRSGKLYLGTPSMEYSTGVNIWHIIEYGSVKNPPYAPMRRGAEAAGLAWAGQ
jgi:hypothetical protein